ncbi:COMPASS complex protein [Lentinula detonsa]|uniref:COMPASS complex protein n=1 Tax=Lentinula detonsa TaxID=2804962 RepID=A0A9W8NQG7_9AGAR|nr:COMPASS complex protein [Lentinula detonsa]
MLADLSYSSYSSPPPLPEHEAERQAEDVGTVSSLSVPGVAGSGGPTGNNTNSKKRKRGQPQQQQQQPAGSPGPSASDGIPEVLTSRTDLFSRPQLKYSRGPIFIPISEGSLYHKTDLVGINRVGFRYVPAGIKVIAPNPNPLILFRTIESLPASSRVSWEDRSPFIHVSKDGLSLLGSKGHRSARLNTPIREGKWYVEVKIVRGGGEPSVVYEGLKEGCYVRLGWGRREAVLNGPVGLDGYSYGIRDKTGEKVTLSRPRPYAKRGFGSGDVIGLYISLPPKRIADGRDGRDPAHLRRERIAIDFKGQEMFEMMEYPTEKEMVALMDYTPEAGRGGGLAQPGPLPPNKPKSSSNSKAPTAKNITKKPTNPHQNPLRTLPTLPDSRIAFFINGECQETAFGDVYDYLQLRQNSKSTFEKDKKKAKESHKDNPFDDGSLGYYPFISLFNDAEVKINPGPMFEYEPPPDIDALLDGVSTTTTTTTPTWRPLCDRYPEYMSEQWALDDKEEQEALDYLVPNSGLGGQEKNKPKKAKKTSTVSKKEKGGDGEGSLRKKVKSGTRKGKSPSLGPGSGLGPGTYPTVSQPSPLRHASVSAYEGYEGYAEMSTPATSAVVDTQETPSSPPASFGADRTPSSPPAIIAPSPPSPPPPPLTLPTARVLPNLEFLSDLDHDNENGGDDDEDNGIGIEIGDVEDQSGDGLGRDDLIQDTRLRGEEGDQDMVIDAGEGLSLSNPETRL